MRSRRAARRRRRSAGARAVHHRERALAHHRAQRVRRPRRAEREGVDERGGGQHGFAGGRDFAGDFRPRDAAAGSIAAARRSGGAPAEELGRERGRLPRRVWAVTRELVDLDRLDPDVRADRPASERALLLTLALLASSLGCCGPRPKAGLKRLPVDVASPQTQNPPSSAASAASANARRRSAAAAAAAAQDVDAEAPDRRRVRLPGHWQNTQTTTSSRTSSTGRSAGRGAGGARVEGPDAVGVSHDGVLVSHTEVPPPFEEQIEHFPLGNGRAHGRAYDAVGGGGDVDTEGYHYSRNSQGGRRARHAGEGR